MLYRGISCCFSAAAGATQFCGARPYLVLIHAVLTHNLYVAPYLVGLIPVCIYTGAMPTEHLRSSLTVIKLQGTVRSVCFWSTGAASGESRQKNQNVIYM